jgi:hypothetical protein
MLKRSILSVLISPLALGGSLSICLLNSCEKNTTVIDFYEISTNSPIIPYESSINITVYGENFVGDCN